MVFFNEGFPYSKVPFVAQNVGPEIQPLPFLETICIREHILLFLLMWFWNNVIHDGYHRQKMVELYCVKLSKPWNWSSCTFHDCCIFLDNAATSPLLWTQSASVCWLPRPGDNLKRVWGIHEFMIIVRLFRSWTWCCRSDCPQQYQKHPHHGSKVQTTLAALMSELSQLNCTELCKVER